MSVSPTPGRYGALAADAAHSADVPSVALSAPVETVAVAALASTPVEATSAAVEAPMASKPVARIIGVLSQAFVLAYAVEYLGKIYRTITLSRPSAKQVGDFFETLSVALDKDDNARVRFPIYFDDEGKPVPDAVLDVLDDDDMQMLVAEADRFLPKRLRVTTDETSSSSPVTGVDTAPTSAA